MRVMLAAEAEVADAANKPAPSASVMRAFFIIEIFIEDIEGIEAIEAIEAIEGIEAIEAIEAIEGIEAIEAIEG